MCLTIAEKNDATLEKMFSDYQPNPFIKNRINKGLCCARLKHTTKFKFCKRKSVEGSRYCEFHKKEKEQY